jgi:hypothetical protein
MRKNEGQVTGDKGQESEEAEKRREGEAGRWRNGETEKFGGFFSNPNQ